jgi:hypothetical protein
MPLGEYGLRHAGFRHCGQHYKQDERRRIPPRHLALMRIVEICAAIQAARYDSREGAGTHA